ncbi:glycosyltransferase family 39 protein [Patulibacter minatonensis]|uniref:glycosyltransferase family 39 protein n=1 Tax=Patulibacter minatonensis TaxID=298163 RepID=UPI0004B9C7EF|nr:glycosyltransferase family 39 protein [Patulibacter minatonensis]
MATQTPPLPWRRRSGDDHDPVAPGDDHEVAAPHATDDADRGRLARIALALRARPELLALLVLAGVLNLWNLGINGQANDYYSAAVKSMSTSWHAFVYGSFDAAGVQTVDKPPLALWVQALSVRLFGFNTWSYLVPQALMGVATVGLTYDVARRVFGRVAGGVAGLALVLTPIAVAISRHNNPDALLILCSVAALWFLVRALEDGRTRWLALSGLMIGLGFETKMAAALTIVPGIVAAWMWIAPQGRLKAVRQLGVFGAVAAVVGLAWPMLMWLTPAGSRPWISGTNDNSIWSLIFGYNGLGRLFGQSGGPATAATGNAGGMGGGGGGMGGVFGGDAGPFRLLNAALGGQAGWLIGTALVAGLGLLLLTRLRRTDARTGFLLAMGGAFLVTAVAFSRAAGIFHPYYVSLLAPFVAAMVGAGIGTVATQGAGAVRIGRGRDRVAGTDITGSATAIAHASTGDAAPASRAAGRRTAASDRIVLRAFGPALILAGVATELVVLHDSATDMEWIAPVLIVGGVLASLALAVGRGGARARNAVLAAIVALLLTAPGAWAVQTLGHATSSTFPAGGPESSGMGMGGPGGGRGMGGPGGQRGGMRGAGGPGGTSSMGTPPAMPGATGSPAGSSAAGGTSSGASASALPPGTTSSTGTSSGTTGGATNGGPGGGMGGGGMFGGNSTELTAAVTYAATQGGGTIGVSSQSSAAASILSGTGSSTVEVAGIGGFSGSESAVTAEWLAQQVENGNIRWVLASSTGQGGPGGGGASGGRVGATKIMALVQEVGKQVPSVDGLYDLQGLASAIRAAG